MSIAELIWRERDEEKTAKGRKEIRLTVDMEESQGADRLALWLLLSSLRSNGRGCAGSGLLERSSLIGRVSDDPVAFID
jgi:hypothetical protein